MRKEDLRLRSWYGEGLFKEEGTVHVLAYDVNDKEMLENKCDFFTEEKRVMGTIVSEVYGELEGDFEDLMNILVEYKYADVDVFIEEYLDLDNHEVEKALQKAYDFINSFELKEVYKHKETGELLDTSQYESKLVVVQK